ncbi:pirin family protein [Rhizobium sp. SAFR-030]|uniref:pirin family protein n=1 Tax=Rhizobium sp. SAFR-030 TaxID=3387277 RepID=UPI003F809129
MTLIHENTNRGHTDTGWLRSDHTFSFGGFQDPTRMGYGALRVINEDRIAPGSGFSEHGHAGMDIMTIVLDGTLAHKDTLGKRVTIKPGEVQLMYAGSGVRHSEMNNSGKDPAHFLQIWLIPDTTGGAPSYQQAAIPPAAGGDWTLVASGEGDGAALRLNSDTRVFLAEPEAGERTSIPVAPGRKTFVHIIEGLAMIDGERLAGGDGLQVGDEVLPDIEWVTEGRALLFDMRR